MKANVMEAVDLYQMLLETAVKLGIPEDKVKWEIDYERVMDRQGPESWFGVKIPVLEGFSQLVEALGHPPKKEIGWFGYESSPTEPCRAAVWFYPKKDWKKADDFIRGKTDQIWESDDDGIRRGATPAEAENAEDWFVKTVHSLRD